MVRGKAIFDNPKPVLRHVEVSKIEKSFGLSPNVWRGRIEYEKTRLPILDSNDYEITLPATRTISLP